MDADDDPPKTDCGEPVKSGEKSGQFHLKPFWRAAVIKESDSIFIQFSVTKSLGLWLSRTVKIILGRC